MNIIDKLNDFINQTKESKEIKRALAVKMTLSGKSYHEVKELLNVSHSFISEWKNQALFHGVESLKLQYKGTQDYLKAVEKEQIIQWMRAQSYLRLIDSTINLLSDIPQIFIYLYVYLHFQRDLYEEYSF